MDNPDESQIDLVNAFLSRPLKSAALLNTDPRTPRAELKTRPVFGLLMGAAAGMAAVTATLPAPAEAQTLLRQAQAHQAHASLNQPAQEYALRGDNGRTFLFEADSGDLNRLENWSGTRQRAERSAAQYGTSALMGAAGSLSSSGQNLLGAAMNLLNQGARAVQMQEQSARQIRSIDESYGVTASSPNQPARPIALRSASDGTRIPVEVDTAAGTFRVMYDLMRPEEPLRATVGAGRPVPGQGPHYGGDRTGFAQPQGSRQGNIVWNELAPRNRTGYDR